MAYFGKDPHTGQKLNSGNMNNGVVIDHGVAYIIGGTYTREKRIDNPRGTEAVSIALSTDCFYLTFSNGKTAMYNNPGLFIKWI